MLRTQRNAAAVGPDRHLDLDLGRDGRLSHCAQDVGRQGHRRDAELESPLWHPGHAKRRVVMRRWDTRELHARRRSRLDLRRDLLDRRATRRDALHVTKTHHSVSHDLRKARVTGADAWIWEFECALGVGTSGCEHRTNPLKRGGRGTCIRETLPCPPHRSARGSRSRKKTLTTGGPEMAQPLTLP